MLYLDSAVTIRGITVFRDYNDKSRFYYFPNAPRLATEAGQPMFQLLIYRDVGDADSGPTGGGFLTMTTDLGVSPGTLQQVANELSGRFGVQATLTPVPVKSGSVRVTALDSATVEDQGTRQTRFVENLIANGTPSLYGDQRAAFTATLSKQGATLMKAALEGQGATPVVLVYTLQYVGLHPAYDVKITIDFRQSYEHLRSRMQMNTLWFKSDIDREMESLRKSGAIKIEEVVYETESPEATADRMTRLNALAKELAQWTFFNPAMNPGTVLAADRGTLEAYDARADVTSITTGLTSTSRAALTGVGSTQDVGTPRRPGAAVATDAVEEQGQTPAQPAPTEPTETPSDQPETAVEAWNRAGRPQGAYMLRSLEQDERHRIEYELRQVAAVERSIAPQGQIRMLPGATDLPGRILEVDLNADFFKTIEGTITTTADLSAMGVASATVKLRYGVKPDGSQWKDLHEATLTAPGNSDTYRFFVDHQGTQDLQYQVVLVYRSGFAIGHDATTDESDWFTTTTRHLDINPLTFSSLIPVSLEAAMVDWDTVQQIQAHVRYEDTPSGIQAADTKILTREIPTASVPIRPKDPNAREVSVEATFFYNDGETETLTLRQSGDQPFILNQPPDSSTVVDVTLTDILDRYKQVSVQLGRPAEDQPDVQRTLKLDNATTSGQWSFRRAQPRDVSFAYRATSFLKNGAVREEDWVTTDNPLVIVGDRAVGVLEVNIMMLGALADGGFRLAKIELTYPDAPSWADPNIEYVFRSGEEEFNWRVPMTRTDATSYTYEVTWFGTDGQRTTTGPVTTNDEILLLDPLAP